MKWHFKMRNIICMFLVVLLAMPQYVRIFAEETDESQEIVYEESSDVSFSETEETDDEEDIFEVSVSENEDDVLPQEPEDQSVEVSEIFISLSETHIELTEGDDHLLEALIEGSAEEKEIVWTSDDPEIVSVDEDGMIHALKEGNTSITVSSSDGVLSANCIVKVFPKKSSAVVFEESSYELMVGEKITVPYELQDGDYKDIIWTVDDEDIVKIDTENDGEVLVETVSSGVAKISAQINGVNSSFSVVILETEELKYASIRSMAKASSSTVTGSFSLTYNQTSARDLAVKLNSYRVDTAQINALTYDYTIEKYAMQRAAEIVLNFDHIRPDGSAFHTVFDKDIYGSESTTNLNENLLCTGDGSMSTSLQVLNRVLADNTQRTRSLRTKNRSFGIAHAVYNGIDYWVMLFSDTPAVNKSQTSALDGEKNVSLKIGSNFFDKDDVSFSASKSVLKVNVNKSVSLPSISGKVNVVLGGKRKAIDFSGYSVSWSLDDIAKKYAKISDGKIVAKSEPNNSETAKLIAAIKMNGSTYEVRVQLKVVQPVTGVTVSPTSAKIDMGRTLTLKATVLPDNASDKSVTWKSSNTKIAAVSDNGVVTGKKGGKVTITAVTNDGGFKASSNIEVIVHPESIAFEIGELTMSLDMEDKLIPVFTPADTTDKRVTFESSDQSKVSVDKNDGTIKALALNGNEPVIITMRSVDGGLTAKLPVTVKDKDRVAKPGGSYLYELTYEVPLYDYGEEEYAETLIKGDQIRLHSDTKDAAIYYTTDGSDPDISSKKYTDPIVFEGGSLIIKAIAAKQPQMKNSEIATYRFIETERATWEILPEDLEKLKGDDDLYHIPSGLWAAGVDKTVPYTGSKITFPNLRVYDRNHMLLINQDYKLSYKNNVNVCPEDSSACVITYKDDGSYVPAKNTKVSYIVVSGKGNYKGNTYIPFKIVPVAISEENGFEYQDELYVSIGSKAVNPIPTILWNGKKLKNKTDYVIAYSKDAQGTQIIENGIKESDLPEGGSSAVFYAIISGIRNYSTPSEKLAVPIHVKKDAGFLSKSKIKIENIEYTGEILEPDDLNLSVTLGKETLEKGKDYTIEAVSPELIKEIGTYTVKIKATEESPYIGEKSGTFKIIGKPLSKAKVYCLGKSVTYTGNTFSIEDLYKYDPKRPDLSAVTLFHEDSKLIEGKDYVIEISGQNKGKGKISFIGVGNYTGTIKKEFTINARPLVKEDLLIYTSDMAFTKNGAYPDVYVFLLTSAEDGYEISDGIYGKLLYEKQDYTLKYFNNKKIYTDDSFMTRNAPSVSVVLKGNYKGTIANNHFLILSEDISYMRMEASDIVYNASKKGSQYYVKPVIFDYQGKKLTLNKDYQLTYYYAQDAKVNGSKTYNRAYGTALRASDIPEPGTVIGVKATGIGSYYGTVSVDYKVFKKGSSLADAKVKIDYHNGKNQYFEYTGEQIVPNAENLKVTLSKNTLVYGVDYEILSISNNIKAGKATMMLRGIGEYAGTKKVTFNIGKQSILLDIGNLLRWMFGLD